MMLPYYIVMGMLNALWIVGVWNAFLPGQILSTIGDWMAGDSKAMPPFEGNSPDWINKPLFLCPMCMASVHGIFWWLMFGVGPWYLLLVYVVCLSGAMKVLSILVLNRDNEA